MSRKILHFDSTLQSTATASKIAHLLVGVDVMLLTEVSSVKACKAILKEASSSFDAVHTHLTRTTDSYMILWSTALFEMAKSKFIQSHVGRYVEVTLRRRDNGKQIKFIVCHLPHKSGRIVASKTLFARIAELHKKKKSFIVAGDFNIGPSDINTKLSDAGLGRVASQLVSFRSSEATTPKGRALDNIVSSFLCAKSRVLSSVEISDHFPILSILEL